MAIKQLLVGFDGNDASRNAVHQAVRMADKYGASITGIHIFRPETFESHIRRWIPDDVMAQMQNVERNAEKEIEQAFRSLIAETGFGGTADWISAQGSPVSRPDGRRWRPATPTRTTTSPSRRRRRRRCR